LHSKLSVVANHSYPLQDSHVINDIFFLSESRKKVQALSPAVVDLSSASVKSKPTHTFEGNGIGKKKPNLIKDGRSKPKPLQSTNRLSGQPVY